MLFDVDASFLGSRAMEMLSELASISMNAPGVPGKVGVTRLPYTDEHGRANSLLQKWMIDAGMTVHLDAAATLVGRIEGPVGSKTLLFGSHQDSVREGGSFDGIMGVVLPIVAIGALTKQGWKPPCHVEVLAFADEEGVRFPTALTGARALAGTIDKNVCKMTDQRGKSLAAALDDFGGDSKRINKIARSPSETLGFVEVHIEQGPVLESMGEPLGIVTGICGIERHAVKIEGQAAHAGTMPMSLRQDALAAAARVVSFVEDRARTIPELRGVIGELHVRPNAVNAIPGGTSFTVELRSVSDKTREAAGKAVAEYCAQLAKERNLTITCKRTYFQAAKPCAPPLMNLIASASPKTLPKLPSGATHDASAMADLCGIAMLFVRCLKGVSHNPIEFASPEDMGLATKTVAMMLQKIPTSTPSRL